MAIRVVLVDDQRLFREGLRMLLSTEPHIQVVGEAADGEQALAVIEQLQPAVALMDLRMPRMDGIEAIERLRHCGSRTRVVALTTFADKDLVFSAIRAGASAYLLKDADASVIVSAIEAAAAGRSMLAPAVTAEVLAEFARMAALVPQSPPSDSLGLTERESVILRLLALGTSTRGIARKLTIAEGTVKNHLSAVYRKLGVSDRIEAVLRARQLGLG